MLALRIHAEINNEESGAIHVWNVHACDFHVVSKPHAGSGQDGAYK